MTPAAARATARLSHPRRERSTAGVTEGAPGRQARRQCPAAHGGTTTAPYTRGCRANQASIRLVVTDVGMPQNFLTCRQSASAHTRSAPSSRAQTTSAANPLAPTWTVRSPNSSPVAPKPRRSCASACGYPHRARSLTSSTSTSIEWTSGGHGLLRALPRSYQVTPETPRPATSDTAKGSQANRPTASKRVSSPPVAEPSPRIGHRRRTPSKQQASKRQRAGSRCFRLSILCRRAIRGRPRSRRRGTGRWRSRSRPRPRSRAWSHLACTARRASATAARVRDHARAPGGRPRALRPIRARRRRRAR